MTAALEPGEKPAEKTTLGFLQAHDAFREAFRRVATPELREDRVLVLLAQSAHESGEWTRMWNYSLSGVKAKEGQNFVWLYTKEHVSVAQAAAMMKKDPRVSRVGVDAAGKTIIRLPQRFRAFSTAADGAEFQIGFLRRNYPAAWEKCLEGDPEGFASALKTPGNLDGWPYYTGPENDYRASCRRLFNAFALRVLCHPDARAFQKAHPPLKVDGDIGEKTRAALLEAVRAYKP